MKSKRAGILIYVLGTIALLGLVVTEFLSEVTGEIQYRAQTVDKEDLREVAWDNFAIIFAALDASKKEEKGIHSPLQPWSKPNLYIPDGYQVSVQFDDETSKVSIYDENQDLINAVLDGIGVSFVDRQNIESSLPDFLKKSPKANYDKSLNTSGSRILYDFNELQELDAFKNTLWNDSQETDLLRKFKAAFSLHHKSKPNINTAGTVIKSILTGVSEIPDDQIVKSKNDLEISINPKWTGYNIDLLNIKLDVLRGPVKLSMYMLLDTKSMTILSLSEV